MELAALKYICEHAGSTAVVPALKMIHVYDRTDGQRRAQVSNGRFEVDVPTDLPVCSVDAARLLAAYQACKGVPVCKCTDLNLMVKAGRVTARIPLFDATGHLRFAPDPESAHTAPGVAALLARLQPFVATDASRRWATSCCLKDGHAYATNNVILVRVPFPATLPGAVNMPGYVFDAIIDKGEPVGMGSNENGLTFYFEDESWIRTRLIVDAWPTGVVDGYLDGLSEEAWETPHPELGMMLGTAAKISTSKHPLVAFTGTGVKLTDDAFEAEELQPLPEQGTVNARMAELVFEHATAVQWHKPKQDVHAFRVNDIVGVFAGQRSHG